MRKVSFVLLALMLSFNAYAVNGTVNGTVNGNANDIEADALVLTDEQSQKLADLKDRLRKEIGPVWDEIQAGRARILEIEKKYFEEFWNMLTPEQKARYEEMNKKK